MAKFNFMEFESSDYGRLIHSFISYCKEKPRLNLGSNIDIRDTHINVDILDLPDLDIRCDINHLDQFMPKEILLELLAYDLLEHFPFSQTTILLKQWVSWLAPEGKIIVRVPDIERLAHALINKTIPTWEIGRLIMGGQDYEFNFHHTCFTGDYLEGLLIGAGCSRIVQVVREPDSFNVTIVAVK